MNSREYQLWCRRFDNHKPYQVLHGLAHGLASEAGEVAGEFEKGARVGRDLDRLKVIDELGDVLWNVARIADELGFTLEQVMERNINKLILRHEERGIPLKGTETYTERCP